MVLAIDWTVSSEIIEGWRTPNWYGLLFVSGLIIGYFVIKKIFSKKNLPFIIGGAAVLGIGAFFLLKKKKINKNLLSLHK